MFTPPTEREIKSFSQDSTYDDNIQLNNNNDSSIKLSNVASSKYLNNQNENNFSNHHHKNENFKNGNFFSDSKKEENQSSSFVNIENGKTNPTEENDSNNTKSNFLNFRSIFQTKKVSFPLQKEKESKNYNN